MIFALTSTAMQPDMRRSQGEIQAVLERARAELALGPLGAQERAQFDSGRARKDFEAWSRIRPDLQRELPV